MKHASLIVVAFGLLISTSGFSQVPSVVNPSFETPVETGGSDTVIQEGAGTSTAVPGWTIVSTGGLFAIDNDEDTPSNALVNQNGSQYLVDVAAPGSGYSGAGTVSQILSTSFAAGQQYALAVWAGNATGTSAQLGDTIFIANSSGKVLASTSLDTAPTNGSLAYFSVPYISTGLFGDTGPIEIGFTSPSQATGSSMAIDDFGFYQALPEPNLLTIEAVCGAICYILLTVGRRKPSITSGRPKL